MVTYQSFVFVFFFVVVLQLVYCQTHSKPTKLPKCEACEVLVDSFLKGVKRTEKNNHAGGNTAWEESQLLSYANSEVRFVEIMETLCEDNNTNIDQCRMLAEEFEDHLEDWWMKGRFEVPDLKHYLCVTKVKFCYPKLTSSVSSSSASLAPSPKGENCPAGWVLQGYSGTCEDVDECWANPCEDFEYCLNTQGSFACRPCHERCSKCSGPGLHECSEYKNFIELLLSLWYLSPTFVFAYVFTVLCVNSVFRIPLLPIVFWSMFVLCLAIKMVNIVVVVL